MRSRYCCVRSATPSVFFDTFVVTSLARFAHCSVLCVSSMSFELGDTHTIMTVRQLPPSENLSSRVSFESLYGT